MPVDYKWANLVLDDADIAWIDRAPSATDDMVRDAQDVLRHANNLVRNTCTMLLELHRAACEQLEQPVPDYSGATTVARVMTLFEPPEFCKAVVHVGQKKYAVACGATTEKFRSREAALRWFFKTRVEHIDVHFDAVHPKVGIVRVKLDYDKMVDEPLDFVKSIVNTLINHVPGGAYIGGGVYGSVYIGPRTGCAVKVAAGGECLDHCREMVVYKYIRSKYEDPHAVNLGVMHAGGHTAEYPPPKFCYGSASVHPMYMPAFMPTRFHGPRGDVHACPLAGTTVSWVYAGMHAGLKTLHSIGLVHGDIKSDNAGVYDDGNARTVVLYDFGMTTPTFFGGDRFFHLSQTYMLACVKTLFDADPCFDEHVLISRKKYDGYCGTHSDFFALAESLDSDAASIAALKAALGTARFRRGARVAHRRRWTCKKRVSAVGDTDDSDIEVTLLSAESPRTHAPRETICMKSPLIDRIVAVRVAHMAGDDLATVRADIGMAETSAKASEPCCVAPTDEQWDFVAEFARHFATGERMFRLADHTQDVEAALFRHANGDPSESFIGITTLCNPDLAAFSKKERLAAHALLLKIAGKRKHTMPKTTAVLDAWRASVLARKRAWASLYNASSKDARVVIDDVRVADDYTLSLATTQRNRM